MGEHVAILVEKPLLSNALADTIRRLLAGPLARTP